MKKTLSIILCLSLLVSTYSFAIPAFAADMTNIGIETSDEFDATAEEERSGVASLAADTTIYNFDFEDSVNNFEADKGVDMAIEGDETNHYLKVEQNGRGRQIKYLSDAGLTPGKYVLSYDLYISSLNDKEKPVESWGFNTLGTHSSAAVAVTGILPETWKTYTYEFTIDSETDGYALYMYTAGSGLRWAQYSYIDNVSLVRKPEACTVKYNANGGTFTETLDDVVAMTGDELTLAGADKLTYDHYIFRGWATSATATEGFEAYTPDRRDFAADKAEITLYAVWEAVTYDVVFNGNGVETAKYDAKLTFREVDGEQTITLPIKSDALRNGYLLAGWNDGTTTFDTGKEVTVDGATTFTAVWKPLSEYDHIKPVSQKPAFNEVNVDMRYPIAYYTFDKAVDPADVNLENLNNANAGGVYYDVDTKTVWVFPKAKSASYGATIIFSAWKSYIPTADGSALLSFPTAKFTLSTTMSDDGENLTPFADMEYNWNPFYPADSTLDTELVTEDGGNHASFLRYNGSATNQVWIYMMHNFMFKSNTTYKVEYDAKFGGFSLSSIASGTSGAVVANTKYKSGDQIDHTDGVSHNVGNVTVNKDNGWQHLSKEQKIRTVTDASTSVMSFYSNPPSGGGAMMYYIDNVKIYEKVGNFFAAAPSTTLTGTQPETIYGYNGDEITLPAEMPYTVDDEDVWTINGWTDGTDTYALGETIKVSGKKTFTPNLETASESYSVKFKSSFNAEIPVNMAVLAGDTIDLTAECFLPGDVDAYNFIGWSTDGTEENIVTSITADKDYVLTAMYELVTEIVFDSEAKVNRQGLNLATAEYDADSKSMVVIPKSDTADDYITTQLLSIDSLDYNAVEITYDAVRGDNENKFIESFKDSAVFFAYPNDSFNWSTSKVGYGTFLRYEDDYTKAVFSYPVGVSANWKGTIGRLRIDPYNGTPEWAVHSIKFVKNEVIDNVAVTDITAPVLRAFPDTTAAVASSANYTAGAVTWTPEYKTRFSGDTIYTASVVLTRKAGYSFNPNATATIDGLEAETYYDYSTGTLTVSYTYPKTDPLAPVKVEISGGNVINVPDGSLKLTGTVTTLNAGDKIDTSKVIWSVDNTKICDITDNGVLTGYYNGEVTVTAASEYDPTKTATVKVTISNQIESYHIDFNSATNGTVTKMPEAFDAKRNIKFPSEIPERDGFIFAGWRTSPDSTEVVYNPFITADTTFYALWCQGTATYEFNTSSTGIASTSSLTNASVNLEEGCYEFTNNGTDPMINVSPNCDASLYKTIEIRFATTASSGSFTAYFTSKDADGNYIGWPWDGNKDHQTQFANNHITVNYTSQGIDTYQVIRMDFSSFSDWQGYISTIRFDPIESNKGAQFKIDYIRLVNYANEVYDITDVVAPVAKAEATNTAKSANVSMYTVKSVNWTPMLLHDYYFDADSKYTVQVVVEPNAGWALSNGPFRSTINGNDAVYVLNNDGTATISYEFPATGTPEDMSVTDLSMIEQDNNGEVDVSRKVFVGSTLNLDGNAPVYVPYGMRWIGWSLTEGDTENLVTSIDFTDEPVTVYALYAPLSEFDFANEYHRTGVTLNTTAATLTYEGNFAVVAPGAANQDVYIITPELGVSAVDYGAIEVIYDGERMGVYDKKEYINKFTSNFKPALLFSKVSAPTSFVTNSPVKAERVIIDGVTCYKYTYNMNANASWSGLVSKLRLDPYNGYPEWAVRSIKLIPNAESDETVKITDLTAPATWEKPDTTARTQSGYSVQSVEWTPELNEFGCYKPETVYTVTLTVKPNAGTKFAEGTLATVNGNVTAANISTETGIMTVIYRFEATKPLKAAHVVISGDAAIIKDGRYSEYKGQTVADDGTTIPYTDVVWSIRNEDSTNTAELATISETGRVFPILNGNVIVTATSVYNPSVKTDYKVVISGQQDKFEIKFDKNTTDEVTNMPDTDYGKGAYTAPKTPVREGYKFAGWATTDEQTVGTSTVNITEATTLYALWAKGLFYEFDSSTEGFGKNQSDIAQKDGCLVVTTTGTDPFVTKSGLSLDPKEYKIIEVTLSAEQASSLSVYFAYKDSSGASFGPTEGTVKTLSFPAASDGEFTTLRFDMSTNSNWKDTIHYLRFDTGSISGNVVKIDSIRVQSSTRNLTLEGNGGTIRVGGRQYDSYTTTCSIGSTKLSYVPMRDGYKFMGWSKNPDSMEKLYTGTMTVVDDTTLYAMWNPTATLTNLDTASLDKLLCDTSDEDLMAMTVSSTDAGLVMKSATTAVNPVVRIADEMQVESNNKTILVKAKYAYKNCTYNKLTLRFKPEGSDEYKSVIIKSGMPKESTGFEYYSYDLSAIPEFDGTITEVDLLLQGGTFTLYTLEEVTFTDADTAAAVIKAANTSTSGGTSGGSSSGGSSSDTDRKQYPIQTQPVDNSPATSSDPLTQKTQSKDTITFDFDEAVDEKLIASFRGMSKQSVADSVYTIQSTGFTAGSKDSPAFFTPATLAIDAATHKYIVMRVKAEITPDTTIRIYFRTADAGFAEARALSVKAKDEYSIVAFDMSKLADWKGTITGLFFSLSGDAKGTLSIDYIMFSNTIPEDKVVTYFPYVNEFTSSTFSDVKSSDWFYGDVEKSYKMGFMNGTSDTAFAPDGKVTLAQAITVAARINSIFNGTTIAEAKDGEEWYTPYVNYAISKKIIKKTQFADYTVNATRSQVAQIFYASMTEDWFKPINVFNSVPDVPTTDAGRKAILGLYNSGVVIGVDEAYNYNPTAEIKRSELSAIINRVALKDSRKRVITQDEIDSKKLTFTGDELAACSLGNCTTSTPKLAGGVISATGKANDAGRADPIVYIGGVIGKIQAGDYKTIKVKMKWNTSDIAKPGVAIFFTTATGSWAAERCIYATWDGTFDDSGFATLTFNCTANAQWAGEITNMRFDPFDAAFDFSIASIDLIP